MTTTEMLSETLAAVGYTSPHADTNQLDEILAGGLAHAAFRHIVHFLTDELRTLGALEECISATTTDAGDLNGFQLELSSFLKEIQCPFGAFSSGPVAERFASAEQCGLLLNYLAGELMVMKMEHRQRPKQEDMMIEVSESAAALALKSIMLDLNLGKPSADVQVSKLFATIGKRVAETIPKADSSRLGPPLFTPSTPLSAAQWDTVAQFQRDLDAEYDLRRDMLATRLDCTVQSFQWGDRHPRAQRDAIAERYAQRRRALDATLLRGSAATTGVPALLAAREDLAVIERTVSAATRTTAGVQKHLMGGVPDRGGRTLEMAAPPPEMPQWTKRSADGGGGGGGGRGRGGGHRGGGRGAAPQPQRQPPQNAGYPSESSGYQQSMGYGNGGGYNGGGQHGGQYGGQHRGGGGRGGGGSSGRVQGGWSQAGSNDNRGQYSNRGGGHQHQHGGGYGDNMNAGYSQQQNGGYQGSGDGYNSGNRRGGGRGGGGNNHQQQANYRRGGGGGGGGGRNW